MAYNSAELLALIQGISTPGKWETPVSLKNSYKEALASYKSNDKLINKSLKELERNKALTDSAQFRALDGLYSRLYESAGELALRRMKGDNSDSFSSPAAAQNFSSFMARKGAAVPTLLKTALKASSADKSARASTIKALREDSELRVNALSSLFNSQFESLGTEAKARRKAYQSLANSLQKSYAIKKKAEK